VPSIDSKDGFNMPLLWTAVAFTCGIWAASWLALPGWVWGALALGTPLAAWLLSRLPGRMLRDCTHWLFRESPILTISPILLLVAAFAGGVRYELSRPEPGRTDISRCIGQGTAIVTGVIAAPPEHRADGSLRVLVSAQEVLVLSGTGAAPAAALPADGLLQANLTPGRAWAYGDRLRLTGRLQAPSENEDYSYREALALQGVFSEMPYSQAEFLAGGQGSRILAAVYTLREKALDVVFALFPPPSSALLAGILLGDDSRIPAELAQAFKDTGTAHIIAISGFNIAILAGLLAMIFSRLFGLRWGAALAAAGIAFYSLLVGGGASVVRAAIMGTLGLLAAQVGRRQVGLNTLGATALGMLLYRPVWVWDAGFQLSFFATLGMILYAGPLQEGFARLAGRIFPGGLTEGVADAVGEYVLFTLAAEAFTLPIQVTNFGRLSFAAGLANPLILPAQSPAMILGGLATLLGMLSPALGHVAAALAWPFVDYTIRVVEALARLPYAVLDTGPVSPLLAAAWMGLMLLPALGRERLRALANRLTGWIKPSMVVIGLGALALFAWRTALAHSDARLRLSLIGGQSGSGLLIQTPDGKALLVDGGSSADRLSAAIGRRTAPFERHLDALVVTGSGQNSLAALPEIVNQYPPSQVLWLGDPAASSASTRLWEQLAQTNIPVTLAQSGMRLDLGNGIDLWILGNDPDHPAAVLVSWQAFRALLPIVKPDRLPAFSGSASLLVLPPDLLKDCSPPDWQKAYHPQAVEQDGLPETELPPNWVASGTHGWIQASTDGARLWVEAER
jgi:competence protein ComEC